MTRTEFYRYMKQKFQKLREELCPKIKEEKEEQEGEGQNVVL